MGLKYEVNSLDDVEEGHRALYAQSGDKYVLSVDGVVSKTKLDEFRNNNVNLSRQLDELNAKFKDVDPELYAQLASEHQKLKDKKLIDAGKIDELVEERVKQLRGTLEGERDTFKGRYETTRSRLETVLIDNEVSRYAVESGCVETALDDIVMRARAQFKLDKDDKAVAMDGEKIVYGGDGVTPMSIKEWMGALVSKAPHLFKGASGGGASGGGGGGASNIRSKADLKSPAEKSKYIKEHGQKAFLELPATR